MNQLRFAFKAEFCGCYTQAGRKFSEKLEKLKIKSEKVWIRFSTLHF